ncbi:MAG: hypothetical protein E7106_04175 [Prevotella sp.]|nr:hypothetical protein [Prevotella sp.]
MKLKSMVVGLLVMVSVAVCAQTKDVLSVEFKERKPASLGGKAGVVFIGEGNDYIITSSVGEECKTVKRVGTQYEYHLQIDMGSKNRESRTFTVKKKGTPYQGKSEQKDVIANQNSIYLITEIKTKLGANERISEGTYLKEVGNKPVMACIEVTVPQELGLKVNVNEALKAVIAKPRVEAGNVIHTIVFDTHRFDELKAIVADYDKQIAELEAKANAEQDENVKKRLWAEQDRIQDTLKVQAEADLANAPIITIEGKGVNTLTIDPSKVLKLRPKAQLLYGVVVVEKEVIKERALTYEELAANAKSLYQDYPNNTELAFYEKALATYENLLAHKDCPNDLRAQYQIERDSLASIKKWVKFHEKADALAKQNEKAKGFEDPAVYKFMAGDLRCVKRLVEWHPEITSYNAIVANLESRIAKHPNSKKKVIEKTTIQRQVVSGTVSFKNSKLKIPFNTLKVFATQQPTINTKNARLIGGVNADGTFKVVKPDDMDYIFVTGEKGDAHYISSDTKVVNIVI